MFPATAAAVAPIKLHAACDVINQTVLYPGVQVKTGAVVFTYAAQDRAFPADSITHLAGIPVLTVITVIMLLTHLLVTASLAGQTSSATHHSGNFLIN
jgi:hypothetical protein